MKLSLQLTNTIRSYREIPLILNVLSLQFLNPYNLSHLCRMGIGIPRHANTEYRTVLYRIGQSVVDQHRKNVVGTVQLMGLGKNSIDARPLTVKKNLLQTTVLLSSLGLTKKKYSLLSTVLLHGTQEKFNRHSTSTKKQIFLFLTTVLLWCMGIRKNSIDTRHPPKNKYFCF